MKIFTITQMKRKKKTMGPCAVQLLQTYEACKMTYAASYSWILVRPNGLIDA